MTGRTPFELSQSGCPTPDTWQGALERLVPALYGRDAEAWKLLRDASDEFGQIIWNLRYERVIAADGSLIDALKYLEHHRVPVLVHLRVALARADQALGRERFVRALTGSSKK